MTKATFNLSLASTSSPLVKVGASSIYLSQSSYSVTGLHKFYLDDDAFSAQLSDLSGNILSIHDQNVGRAYEFPSSAFQTGRCFFFNGTSSYIRADSTDAIQKTEDFTLKAILYPLDTTSRQVIAATVNGTSEPYEWYIESGKIHFKWDNFIGDTVVKTGHTVSANATQAVYVSFANDEVVFRHSSFQDIVYTGSNFYVNADASPLFIGGNGEAKTNYFSGYLGKFQYEDIAQGTLSDFTVSALFSTASIYAEVTASIFSGAIAYDLNVDLLNPRNCSLGFQMSTNSGASWYFYDGSSWSSTTNTISSIYNINQGLKTFPFGSSQTISARVYFASSGLDGGGIASMNMNYVHTGTVSAIEDLAPVVWGKTHELLETSFINPAIRPSSDPVLYIGGSSSGPFTTVSSFLYGSWSTRNDYIVDAEIPVDAVFADSALLNSTQSGFSIDKYLVLSAGSNAGAPYSDSGGTTVSIRGHYVTLSSYTHLGQLDMPAVSVFDIQYDQKKIIIDNFALTSSGHMGLMLIPGSYEFYVTTSNGDYYSFSRTIQADVAYEFRASPPIRESIQPIRSDGIDVIVDTVQTVVGDTPTITFRVIDKMTGLPMNLSNYNVFLRARPAHGSVLKINRQCSVSDSRNGTAVVTLTATDTDTAGRFLCELRITSITGAVITNTSLPRFYIDMIRSI